ncbi:MAG: hypothetical protein Ct9H90mP7_5010 [Candidatus Neomarinimicrobiota bacterium]|nr:MAG: hypothetical protein Ct9H90mP7_5010 [Candidatus Neomarinimicrobiota bacterium]
MHILQESGSPGEKNGTCRSNNAGGKGTRENKFLALEKAGVHTTRSPAKIGEEISKLV